MPPHFLLEKLINHSTRHLALEQKQRCGAQGGAEGDIRRREGSPTPKKKKRETGCVSVDRVWEDLIAGESQASTLAPLQIEV